MVQILVLVQLLQLRAAVAVGDILLVQGQLTPEVQVVAVL
jgi:hypothetical protein